MLNKINYKKLKMSHKMFSAELLQSPDYKHLNISIGIFYE